MRFDRVNSEKERLKNDIEELRHIRYPITGVQLEMLSLYYSQPKVAS